MNILKVLNTIALSIPLFIASFAIFNESALIIAAISTIGTGIIQLLTGIYYWKEYRKSIHIKIYFFFVLLFFTLLFLGLKTDIYWFLPPILCIYLSILVYKQKP
ncbi:hypothetical protein [Flavobacterium macrobrachii]|uniref:Uncharacterized protein n=1 Tax=Flavobacterium macrobrachii TaxID=591204 RepID=A0ABS2D0B8_9FLAO|nr:hypothetical protein [Flavobacterium macrobrachii]MBM6500658.1 hypothetical protein [Flavobacterium macrobrachii]PZO27258.1 MAG: hypothetical protein DCF13_12045 [Flavobacteriaceae bacterium]